MLTRRKLLAATLAAPFFTKNATAYAHFVRNMVAEHRARQFGLCYVWGLSTFAQKDTALDGGVGLSDQNLFDPGNTLNVGQWLDLAVTAKATYAVLVAKHVDGHCLWPTASTPYNVSSSAWYASHGQPDIVKLFVDGCNARGLAAFLFFEIWDYKFQVDNGFSAELAWYVGNRAAFRSYLETQLNELLTNYGKIAGIWFDGGSWHFTTDTGLPLAPSYPWPDNLTRNAFVSARQPGCMIIDNNHYLYQENGQIQVFEYAPVSTNPTTFNVLPSEQISSIRGDHMWFWHTVADTPYDAPTVISVLQATNAKNCNLLLDVPPDDTGRITSDLAAILTAVGAR